MQSAQFQLHAEIEDRHWWFVARRRILARIVREVVPANPAATLVDVGCGTGANLGALAADYRCIGVDTSAEAIELARSRFSNARFVHGFAPGSVQRELATARLVLLTDVLEHVRDDFELFSTLLAATTPGAYFLVTVPADLALWTEHDESFGHYRRYDLARFRQVWSGLPISEVFATPYNARLYPIVRAIRARNRRRGHASGAVGTDFEIPSAPLNWALTRAFAGEARRLAALSHGAGRPYQRGVSLIALLRRETGPIEVRHKPANAPADYFDPAQRNLSLVEG